MWMKSSGFYAVAIQAKKPVPVTEIFLAVPVPFFSVLTFDFD